MKAKEVIQVRLKDGDTVRVCWIDNGRAKVGSKITLKNSEEPKRRWTVEEIFSAMDPALLHTDWQVGGLE